MLPVSDVILTILLLPLILVLLEILRAVSMGGLLVPPQPRPRLQFDWTVLAVASGVIFLNILPRLLRPLLGSEKLSDAPPSFLAIAEAILTHVTVVAVLISLIVGRGKNRLADYGIEWRGWLAEVRFGGLGFVACLPFVIAIMRILGSFRSENTQNPLLILMQRTGSEQILVGAVFIAAVSAPLTEELLFRVAYQGMLETRLPAGWAIGISTFIFAAVHGVYDALPLLPLALTLGLLYHFRRSYVAVVTTHALFNATFLVLALWRHGSS
jgi:membrane protease YdiL (CAAX protease family)